MLSYAANEVSLREVLSVLWRYRGIIVFWTLAFACLVAVGMSARYMVSETALSRLQFKLNFEGAGNGKYPNGLDFSPKEIIAPHILDTVFASNDLERLMSEQEFRDSVGVMKSDGDLSFLEEKYSKLLTEKRITDEVAWRIREEYESEKSKFLEQAHYQLVFKDSDLRVPRDLQAKVLEDVLTAWAKSARDNKGVYLYDVPMLTEDLFVLDEGSDQGRIVQYDSLRRMILRAQQYADKVAKLPGVLFARTSDGSSITAVQMRLRDLERFHLIPLVRIIRESGSGANNRSDHYLEEQVHDLSLREQELASTVELLRGALSAYSRNERSPSSGGPVQSGVETSGAVAQVGEQFLDRLVAMANESKDAMYRQSIIQQIIDTGKHLVQTQMEIAYYRDLAAHNSGGLEQSDGPEMAEAFNRAYDRALDELKLLVAETTALYRSTSNSYLRAEQKLFSVLGPMEYKVSSPLALERVVATGIALVAVFFVIMAGVCFIRGRAASRP